MSDMNSVSGDTWRNKLDDRLPGGRLISTVMASHDGHRGWINYLAVDPHDQGSGIGNRLMAEAERLLAELGCAKVTCRFGAATPGSEPSTDAWGTSETTRSA